MIRKPLLFLVLVVALAAVPACTVFTDTTTQIPDDLGDATGSDGGVDVGGDTTDDSSEDPEPDVSDDAEEDSDTGGEDTGGEDTGGEDVGTGIEALCADACETIFDCTSVFPNVPACEVACLEEFDEVEALPEVCQTAVTDFYACARDANRCAELQAVLNETNDDPDASCAAEFEDRKESCIDCDDVLEEDLGSEIGPSVAATGTGAADDNFDTECGSAAGDRAYTWTAPAEGSYRFVLNSNTDLVLSVREASCVSDEVECIAAGTPTRVALDADQTVTLIVDGAEDGVQGMFAIGIFDADADEICDNGTDEDGDGSIDCADAECMMDEFCTAPSRMEICTDICTLGEECLALDRELCELGCVRELAYQESFDDCSVLLEDQRLCETGFLDEENVCDAYLGYLANPMAGACQSQFDEFVDAGCRGCYARFDADLREGMGETTAVVMTSAGEVSEFSTSPASCDGVVGDMTGDVLVRFLPESDGEFLVSAGRTDDGPVTAYIREDCFRLTGETCAEMVTLDSPAFAVERDGGQPILLFVENLPGTNGSIEVVFERVVEGPACTEGDLAYIEDNRDAMFDDMLVCSAECVVDGAECAAECIGTRHGRTDACNDCFGSLATCGIAECVGPCISGQSAECNTCVANNCGPEFEDCSGSNLPSNFFVCDGPDLDLIGGDPSVYTECGMMFSSFEDYDDCMVDGGVSPACADCIIDTTQCINEQCGMECAGGDDEGCELCRNDRCGGDINRCVADVAGFGGACDVRECRSDGICTGDGDSVERTCVRICDDAGECDEGQDCLQDMSTGVRTCVVPCETDSTCDEFEACGGEFGTGGACLPDASIVPYQPCNNDSSCPAPSLTCLGDGVGGQFACVALCEGVDIGGSCDAFEDDEGAIFMPSCVSVSMDNSIGACVLNCGGGDPCPNDGFCRDGVCAFE